MFGFTISDALYLSLEEVLISKAGTKSKHTQMIIGVTDSARSKLTTIISWSTLHYIWCTSVGENIEISYEGEPNGQTKNITADGSLTNTSGTFSIPVGQGYTVTTSFGISSSDRADLSGYYMPMMTFPDVVGIMDGFSASASISNTVSNNSMKTHSNMETTTLTLASRDGEKCDVTVVVRTCIFQGFGTLRFVASGWVWFEYTNKVDGHYEYRVNLQEVLLPALRSGKLTFSGPITVEQRSAYQGSCRKP
ncbi:hypothetical protein J3R30DRAFT_3679317 [Lentinula aciculospora]|uniref:Uncharacterized protein n=1 Tax=Lentinula aciculospora TaxID=153920 RepID=A0A9W9DVB2_9AGAR|nr:hypothetical protein J3R30DRAFT_3679317 [Lentinula aciculospora]